MTRASRSAIDLLVGLAAALVVFAAVPTVLVAVVGRPMPSHVSVHTVVSLHGLFDALTIVSWCAWACCAWPILRAVARRVRFHDVSGATAVVDRVALRIAVAVLALSSLLGVAAVTGGTAAATAVRPPASTAVHPRPRGAALSATWAAVEPIDPYLDHGSVAGGRSLVVAGVVEPRGSTTPPPLPPELPAFAALGAGAVLTGLLARRLRRARRRYAFARAEGQRAADPDEAEADVGALVARFGSVSMVRRVELACRHLHFALDRAGALETAPPVLWMRTGADGVEARFAAPASGLSDGVCGWESSAASAWLLPSTLDPAQLEGDAARYSPWCPALLPLGDDERGTWLLALHAGSELAVVGPAAEVLVRAMRAGVESWNWSDQLVVTDDTTTALEAARVPGAFAGTTAPSLVFFGDPTSLPEELRRASAAVTLVPFGSAGAAPSTAVTVIVDARAATVHPYGVSVRPHLLASDVLRAIESSERRYASPESASPHGDVIVDDGTGSRPLATHSSAIATVRLSSLRTSGPAGKGQAEVRLLQSVPDIFGLAAPIDPKRARRAVELVAYLAVHHPDAVTGDRLRTRVLGSPDVDAAAKTLFNTAGAARQALGTGPGGDALFPPATRSGHYRLSPLVTVDALRCLATIGEARVMLPQEPDVEDEDGEEAARLVESALELVRGEPLSGVLTGFGWWTSEGHERRLADEVVDGACALTRISISRGHLDRARWALDRARAVEPYSEALTRAALRLAAASGDAHRLQREWNECVRQADEIDPGALPSAATEQLFVSLRTELAARGRQTGEAVLRA